MALTTLAALNSALPGQRFEWQKTPAGLVSAAWYSPWTVAGLPGQGVAPSSGLGGNVPTSATVGAFPFVNPASGFSYLARLNATMGISGSSSPLTLAVYDRLWHNSGISSTITTAQTVSANDAAAVALTRSGAVGAEAWWEVYVVMGAGTPTVTLTYTNQSGTSSRTGSSGALATTMALGRTERFTLNAGDTGVKSIQTWQASATFSSGTIGLVIRKLLCAEFLEAKGSPSVRDALRTGMPRIYDDACLEVLFLPTTGTAPNCPFSMFVAQG